MHAAADAFSIGMYDNASEYFGRYSDLRALNLRGHGVPRRIVGQDDTLLAPDQLHAVIERRHTTADLRTFRLDRGLVKGS